jgi:hypothetical protein
MVLQPDPVVDLFAETAFAALVASVLCITILFVTWLYRFLKFIGLPASRKRDEYFRRLNIVMTKLLTWVVGIFFFCLVIVVTVIWLIRLIRSFL